MIRRPAALLALLTLLRRGAGRAGPRGQPELPLRREVGHAEHDRAQRRDPQLRRPRPAPQHERRGRRDLRLRGRRAVRAGQGGRDGAGQHQLQGVLPQRGPPGRCRGAAGPAVRAGLEGALQERALRVARPSHALDGRGRPAAAHGQEQRDRDLRQLADPDRGRRDQGRYLRHAHVGPARQRRPAARRDLRLRRAHHRPLDRRLHRAPPPRRRADGGAATPKRPSRRGEAGRRSPPRARRGARGAGFGARPRDAAVDGPGARRPTRHRAEGGRLRLRRGGRGELRRPARVRRDGHRGPGR